jgi:hypothetical protein
LDAASVLDNLIEMTLKARRKPVREKLGVLQRNQIVPDDMELCPAIDRLMKRWPCIKVPGGVDEQEMVVWLNRQRTDR